MIKNNSLIEGDKEMVKRILVLGGSGFIGKSIMKELDSDHEILGTYYNNPNSEFKEKMFKFDVNDITSVKYILKKSDADIVVSCLRGDYDKQLKFHIEAAKYLKKTSKKMLFCSSANVFDKNPTKAYYEDDPTIAGSEYGIYKETCEKEMKQILEDDLIIARLPMIFGKESPRIKALKKALENDKGVYLYENLYASVNTNERIAKQIRFIIEEEKQGVFHLASEDVINHLEFYKDIVREMGYSKFKFGRKKFKIDKYYLAILANRTDLSDDFEFSSRDVIKDII
jgi:dTDP-4-dehydrorhamnose reductase